MTNSVDPLYSYNAVLLAHKGSVACEHERKRFALCRATSVGRSGDPSFCENQAADFLQCYHEMVQYVKKNCQNQYLEAFKCLQESDSKGTLSQMSKYITGGAIDEKICKQTLTQF